MTRNCHQGKACSGSCHQSIATNFRLHTSMRRRALKTEVDLSRAEEFLGRRYHFATRNIATQVTDIEVIQIINNTTLSHRTTAARTFFSWFKNQLNRTAELIFIGCKPRGQPHQYSLVTVVATSMHVTGDLRGITFLGGVMFRIRGFCHRQCIQVAKKTDRRSWTACFQNTNHTRCAF